MRSSIAAQSCASVPPAPAWMSMKQLRGSIGLLNIRRNSSSATVFSSLAASASIATQAVEVLVGLRPSRTARLLSGEVATCRWSIVATTVSSVFFSRPSSWARLGSSQTLGFSSAALTSFSRSALRS